MFKKEFKKFDFRGFIDFIYDLIDKYKMSEIRFFPEHRELFSEIQLSHIAPYRNINNSNGFVWAWKQKENEVKKVSFDLFAEKGIPKITMTIDLDKKYISLDSINGISVVQIEESLNNNLIISKNKTGIFIHLFKKYITEIIIGIIIAVFAGIILSYIIH